MDDLGSTAAEIDSAGAHWTARELLQQPYLWPQIEALIADQLGRLARFLDPLLNTPQLRIVLTGAGTSAFIGECLAPALARRLAARVEAIATTDLIASPESCLSAHTPTLVVSFGRSGNSPESVAALDIADEYLQHCSHLIVTCNAQGELYRRGAKTPRAFVILLPEACNDRGFAMTSSFTGMLLAAALAMRALPAAGGCGALSRLARQIVPQRIPLLQGLVKSHFRRVVYLGAKEFKGLAREAALKMLELTDGKVIAVAESPLGFRHGPKTILNDETLVIVFGSNHRYTRQYDLDIVGELRREAVAARVLSLSARPLGAPHSDNIVLETAQDGCDDSDLGLCLPYAVFAQAFALLSSISLGVRPDSPNAAGTVSRVVRGVSIHPWREDT